MSVEPCTNQIRSISDTSITSTTDMLLTNRNEFKLENLNVTNNRIYDYNDYFSNGTYVLSSEQFDSYYEYLKQRGNVRFTFYGWPNIENGLVI